MELAFTHGAMLMMGEGEGDYAGRGRGELEDTVVFNVQGEATPCVALHT